MQVENKLLKSGDNKFIFFLQRDDHSQVREVHAGSDQGRFRIPDESQRYPHLNISLCCTIIYLYWNKYCLDIQAVANIDPNAKKFI